MSKICQPKELFKIKPIVIWSEGMHSRTKHFYTTRTQQILNKLFNDAGSVGLHLRSGLMNFLRHFSC